MFKDRHVEIKLSKTSDPTSETPTMDDRAERHIDHMVECTAAASKAIFGAIMIVKLYDTFDEIALTIIKSKFK